MEELAELQERLSRYSRLEDNEDLKKTIKELSNEYGLNGSAFPICNCPNASEYLWAREGVRTFVNRLNGLKDETMAAIEIAKEQEKQEDE